MTPSQEADWALVKALETWEAQGFTSMEMLSAMRRFIHEVEQRAARQAVVET